MGSKSRKSLLLYLLENFLFGLLISNDHINCFESHLGFGQSRLRSFRGHGIHNYLEEDDPIDPLVVEKRFKEAVVDNFATISGQAPWFSGGPRYWVNDRFCSSESKSNCTKGPLFLYIGGEGPLTGKSLSERMSIYDFARENDALMVAIEHRFYGESYPTNDTSIENLKYLSSAQALADLARFIPAVRNEYKLEKDAKVIAFGGSYPGSLSAWVRLKYPHLVDGSIASSAPILAQLEFPEYMDVCQRSLEEFGGVECADILAEGADALRALLGGDDEDLNSVSADFHTCAPLSNEDDIWVFASNIMGDLQGAVQYNRQKKGVLNVTDICDLLSMASSENFLNRNNLGSIRLKSDEAASAYTALVNLNSAFRKGANETCLESEWKNTMAELKNVSYVGSSRQWTYQTCNEFGYFQTAASVNQPYRGFSDIVNLESFLRICRDAFGIVELPQIDYMNSYFGGLDIRAHRVAFPSGSLDPWSILAVNNVTVMKAPEEIPVYIPNTAHCEDMHSGEGTLHTPELDAAKEQISSLVKLWVSTDENHDREVLKIKEFRAEITIVVALFSVMLGVIMAVAIITVSTRRKKRQRLEVAMSRRVLREPLLGSL